MKNQNNMMQYGHSPYARLCVFYKPLQSQTDTGNFISSTRLANMGHWKPMKLKDLNLVGIKIKQNKMSRS